MTIRVGDLIDRRHYNKTFDLATTDLADLADTNLWPRSTITNNEQQYYLPQDKGLHLREEGQEGVTLIARRHEEGDQHTQPYSSALLSTHNVFSQRFGLFEMRAKMPKGRGVWPAFWLLPEFSQWPPEFITRTLPEIDILEYIGDDPKRYYAALHYYDYTLVETGEPAHLTWRHDCEDNDLTEEFHTYSFLWDENQMGWALDHEILKVWDTPRDWGVDGRPAHIILNLALGGTWAGEVELVGDEARFEIEYVHAYAWDDSSEVHNHTANQDIINRLIDIQNLQDEAYRVQHAALCAYVKELQK